MSTSAKLQQVVEIALADQFWTYADTQSLAKERSDAARAALRDHTPLHPDWCDCDECERYAKRKELLVRAARLDGAR